MKRERIKALTDEQIAEVKSRRLNGAKVMQLANEYHVHYRTIENYCKDIRRLPYRKAFIKRFMEVT
jgi:Cft2 family RNA processing exonuclease